MPLPTLIKTHAEMKIQKFCEKRVPSHVRDKVRLAFKFRGSCATIFEERAPWREELTEWTSLPVAQMRYDEKTGRWTLYCADQRNKWHEYPGLVPTKKIGEIIKEIDEDPTRIFWG